MYRKFIPELSPEEKQSFWSTVKQGDSFECWPCSVGPDQYGYAHVHIRGKKYKAHRVAYRVANGSLDPQDNVLHSCDNPPCCNPAHLFAGSQADNVQDMLNKGRDGCLQVNKCFPMGDDHWTRKNPERVRKGEEVNTSRLTSQDVKDVYRFREEGLSLRQIGERYGVTKQAIWLILKGKNWKDVT